MERMGSVKRAGSNMSPGSPSGWSQRAKAAAEKEAAERADAETKTSSDSPRALIRFSDDGTSILSDSTCASSLASYASSGSLGLRTSPNFKVQVSSPSGTFKRSKKRFHKRTPQPARRGDGLVTEQGQYILQLPPDYLQTIAVPTGGKPDPQPSSSENSPCFGLGTAPALNVCLMAVGPRDRVAPFAVLGEALKNLGHRVRLATHSEHREWVTGYHGLEFYPLGGDTAQMAQLATTAGRLLPTSVEDLSDMEAKIQMVAEVTFSTYLAATAADPGAAEAGSDPFVANAIISHPETFGHCHVAEGLGIPLQLITTTPWLETSAIPHPMVHVPNESDGLLGAERSLGNLESYRFIDELEWASLGNIINGFRLAIGLEPIRSRHESPVLRRAITTSFWSPQLLRHPPEWTAVDALAGLPPTDTEGKHVATREVKNWLGLGKRPVLITFGDVVLGDTRKFFRKVLKAAFHRDTRILFHSTATAFTPPTELMTEAPHMKRLFCIAGPDTNVDYIMPRCVAVIHSGCASLSSRSLRYGLPTLTCPIHGEDHFWARLVYDSGVGPAPVTFASLQERGASKVISKLLRELQSLNVQQSAQRVAERLQNEDPVMNCLWGFRQSVPVEELCCTSCVKRQASGRGTQLRRLGRADVKVLGTRERLCLQCYAVWTQHDRRVMDKYGFTTFRLYHMEPIESVPEGRNRSKAEIWGPLCSSLVAEVAETATAAMEKQPSSQELQGADSLLEQIKLARTSRKVVSHKNLSRTGSRADQPEEENPNFDPAPATPRTRTDRRTADPRQWRSSGRSKVAEQSVVEINCSEKHLMAAVKGKLYIEADELVFVASRGQATSSGEPEIHIRYDEIAKLTVNQAMWDGTGLMVQTVSRHTAVSIVPLMTWIYNFTNMASEEEVETCRAAILLARSRWAQARPRQRTRRHG